jgi:hypothetical protein
VLPPAAVARWASGAPEGSHLAALKSKCELHLAARHSAERLLRCWGSGAGKSHAETKERIAKVGTCVERLLQCALRCAGVSRASDEVRQASARGLATPCLAHGTPSCSARTYTCPAPRPPAPAPHTTTHTHARARQLLSEYLDSHDASEASRCLRGLSVPFFHHELVKQGLHAAMEAPPQAEHVLALFKRCVCVCLYVRVGTAVAWRTESA